MACGVGRYHVTSVLYSYWMWSIISFYKDTPDVAVSVTNTTTVDVTTDLRCEAQGVPISYTYVTWEHTWPGHELVLRSYPGSKVLHLSNMTYEYSGYYTCRVENGVRASRNPKAGVGTAYLQIEGTLSLPCWHFMLPYITCTKCGCCIFCGYHSLIEDILFTQRLIAFLLLQIVWVRNSSLARTYLQ